MNKKCPNCSLANYPDTEHCIRCEASLLGVENTEITQKPSGGGLIKRALICAGVCCVVIFGFYFSLAVSARSLASDQRSAVRAAIALLNERGFSDEIFLLRNFAVFRGDDNWLNASVDKEDAYAATNFPFEIITLYPDFFTYPGDDTERAAILLHESRHLRDASEHDAYEYVWKHRKQLGWTREKYQWSVVWRNVRRQTKENVPELFVCEANELGDCTE